MRLIKKQTYYEKPWYNSYRCMKSRCYEVAEILSMIDDAPTVEAEPIKYGYWEWVDGSLDNYDLKCTVCGRVQDSGFWERCPYCGAKMKNGE